MCSVRAHIVSEDDLDVLCVKGKTHYDKYTCNEFKFDWRRPISIENEKAAVAAMTHSIRGLTSGFTTSLDDDLLALEQGKGASVNDHHSPLHSALLLRLREKKALHGALMWLEDRAQVVDEMIERAKEQEDSKERDKGVRKETEGSKAKDGSVQTNPRTLLFQAGEIRALRKRQQVLAQKRAEWAETVRRTMDKQPVLANITVNLVNPKTGSPAPAHVVVREGDDLKVVLARFAGEHGIDADGVASIEGALKPDLVKATPVEILSAMQLIVPSGDVKVLKILEGGGQCNETVRKFCALYNISMLPHDYPLDLRPEKEENDEEERSLISSCGKIMSKSQIRDRATKWGLVGTR